MSLLGKLPLNDIKIDDSRPLGAKLNVHDLEEVPAMGYTKQLSRSFEERVSLNWLIEAVVAI